MSEIIIDGCAWIPKEVFPDKALREIKRENVVKLKPGPYDDEATAVKVYRETPTHIGLPRGFFEETSNGIHDITYDVSERPLDVECQIEPRDEMQVKGVRDVTKRLQQRRVTQTIFRAGTGCGKSCMSLMVANEVGLAPLILTHTSAIMSNWIKQIKKDPGVFPDANVGVFKGDTREFGDDYDIVVGMIQTLINREADHPIFEWPGIILVDEVHRMAAPVFSKVISRFNAAKRLGFSATIRRKDGGEPVFFKNLGRVCWEGGETNMTPLIRPVQTDFYIKDDVPSWLEKKWMTEDEDRNQIIVDEAIEAYEAGRNPMVMTCFVSHIALLKERIEDRCDADVGLCCGSYYTDEDEAIEYIRNGKQFQDKFDTDEIIDWWLEPEDTDPPENFDPDSHKARFKWKEEREKSGPGHEVVSVDVLADKYQGVKPKKDDDGEWIDSEEGERYEDSQSDFQSRFDHSKVVRWIKYGKSYSAPDPFDPETHRAVFSEPVEDILFDLFVEVEPRTETISTEQFDDVETKKDILLSTFGKIKEGFDEPRLDAGILAIPKSDPEQLVGRFTREVEGKQDPVFTHLIDDRMGKFEWKWEEAKKIYRGMDAEVYDL